MHCGHPTGLTPPAWQFRLGQTDERDLLSAYQSSSWLRYERAKKAAGKADALLVLGDCIDGRETGRQLVSEDREDQCEMAKECIRIWKAPSIVMVYGTRRHTGDTERWEALIAKDLGADIGSREFVEIEGVMFKLRHKVGRSSIPHGGWTSLAKSAVWNELRAARGKDVRAHVNLFAHRHQYSYAGGPNWLSMGLPGLQGSSEYGAEEIDDDVDFGIVWFDVEDGQYDWTAEIAVIEQAQAVIRL
jgi:hypothetical protein